MYQLAEADVEALELPMRPASPPHVDMVRLLGHLVAEYSDAHVQLARRDREAARPVLLHAVQVAGEVWLRGGGGGGGGGDATNRASKRSRDREKKKLAAAAGAAPPSPDATGVKKPKETTTAPTSGKPELGAARLKAVAAFDLDKVKAKSIRKNFGDSGGFDGLIDTFEFAHERAFPDRPFVKQPCPKKSCFGTCKTSASSAGCPRCKNAQEPDVELCAKIKAACAPEFLGLLHSNSAIRV